PFQYRGIFRVLKTLSGDVLVEFNISFRYGCDNLIGHFRHCLSFFSLKSIFYQPFANKFLRQLPLWFAVALELFVGVRVKITGGIRGMDFIDQDNSVAQFAELILGVNRSEEHTSELQSRENLVCRLLLEKK